MAKQQKEGGGRAARLEARLGTLETRLQMLETAMRTEVERVHLAAEQLDSAVRDVRGTLGDVGPLHERLATVANDVRALDERPDIVVDLSPIHRHLDAIGHAIEGIAARPEATVDLGSIHEHLEVLAQGLDVIAARPETVLDLNPVHEHLEALRADVAAGDAELRASRPDATSSLQALAELIDSMRESATEGQQRLELLSSRVGATAARLDDVLAGIALAVDQIESSAAAQRQGIAAVLAQIETPPAPLPPPPPPAPGPGAEVVARLEGRMDVEFDDVARQLDALGTLLQQTIEAIDRVESQITGAQPETDRMRSVARGTIETLRETSRGRIARRTAPPELNR